MLWSLFGHRDCGWGFAAIAQLQIILRSKFKSWDLKVGQAPEALVDRSLLISYVFLLRGGDPFQPALASCGENCEWLLRSVLAVPPKEFPISGPLKFLFCILQVNIFRC